MWKPLRNSDNFSILAKLTSFTDAGPPRGLMRNQQEITTHIQSCYMFLAATKQLYDWFSPSVHPNELRLSADDGSGYCDFILDNNGGGQS